jgi:Ca2+-binding EF-hand superfamily protein
MPTRVKTLIAVALSSAALVGHPASGQQAARPATSSPATAQTPKRPAVTPTVPAPVPAAAPAPPPPAQSLFRSGFITEMDAEFRAKDSDNDGRLTRGEIETFERNAAMAAAVANNRRAFAIIDADHNGMITPAEFALQVVTPPTPDVQPIMTRFDANRDQSVSMIEYRAATLASFDRLDTDHDGIVTSVEMRAGGVTPAGR